MTNENIVLITALSVFIVYSLCSEAFGKSGLIEGEKIYIHYCSPCHGIKGDAHGFNAKNLDPRPADHTDFNLMTKRTDADLFEAISGGGKRVGKSTLMPPWGNTFNKEQIKSLVRYLRKLCRCRED
jgi:mono/diheme cytochrome c family protein